ncbi:MAG: MipA/OmpV family protein [Pseudomonadota bacterium]
MMTHIGSKTVACLAAASTGLTLIVGSSALAQPPSPDGWSVSAGFGTIYSPAYLGDDSYQLSVLPNIEVRYGNKFTAGVQGIQYTAVDRNGWKAGPVARIGFGRGDDGSNPFALAGPDTNDLDGLDEIDPSFEYGGFVSYTLGKVTTTAELRKGAGGHEAILGDFSIQYRDLVIWRGKPLIFSLGPSLSYAGDDFNDTFFSIDAEDSAASGLSVFEADGGINAYGFDVSVIRPLTKKTSVVFFASYDELQGDVADSSLVVERGARDQATAGIFYSYRF